MRSALSLRFTYVVDRLWYFGHVWAFLFDFVDYRLLFTVHHCSLAIQLRIHILSSTQRLSRTVFHFPSYLCACLLPIHYGSYSLYFKAITIASASRGSFLPPQLLAYSANHDGTNNNDKVSFAPTDSIRLILLHFLFPRLAQRNLFAFF